MKKQTFKFNSTAKHQIELLNSAIESKRKEKKIE